MPKRRERDSVQGTMILSNIPTCLKLTISLDSSKIKKFRFLYFNIKSKKNYMVLMVDYVTYSSFY